MEEIGALCGVLNLTRFAPSEGIFHATFLVPPPLLSIFNELRSSRKTHFSRFHILSFPSSASPLAFISLNRPSLFALRNPRERWVPERRGKCSKAPAIYYALWSVCTSTGPRSNSQRVVFLASLRVLAATFSALWCKLIKCIFKYT